MGDLHSKFQQIWRNFCHFWKFCLQNRFFRPTRAYDWDIFWREDLHFWVFHDISCMFRNGRRISSHSGLPKGPKTPWKSPFCHLLHQQEVVLGEWSFGGENEFQIENFQLGWIADIQGFPTSYHEVNLNSDKCSKNRSKVAWHIELWSVAHRGIQPIFHLRAQEFGQFWLVSPLYVIFDLAWCNMVTMM